MRPEPAASLIVVHQASGNGIKVLMGRRPESMAFLPGVFVFPGGKVERADGHREAHFTIQGYDYLQAEFARPLFAQRFLPCALRECLEETGVDLEASCRTGPLAYVARAITPPDRSRRYDTRFFMLTLSTEQPPVTPGSGDGELEAVGWYNPATFTDGALHHVTRKVLKHVLNTLAEGTDTSARPILMARRRPKRWAGQLPAL